MLPGDFGVDGAIHVSPGRTRHRDRHHASALEAGARPLVVFTLMEQRYAVDLALVERVLPSMEVTPVPKAPEIVPGLVNVHGRVIPVVDMRRRFRLPVREMDVGDKLILARAGERTVALLVDEVPAVVADAPRQPIPVGDIVPGLEHLEGVLALEDGTILIHDLRACLSLEEGIQLDNAVRDLSDTRTDSR